MQEVEYSLGAKLFQKAEKLESMYVLVSGEIEYQVRVKKGQEKLMSESTNSREMAKAVSGKKTPGWVFGDLDCLFDRCPSGSIVTKSDDCVMLILKKENLIDSLNHFSKNADSLLFMKHHPMLKHLDDDSLFHILEQSSDKLILILI